MNEMNVSNWLRLSALSTPVLKCLRDSGWEVGSRTPTGASELLLNRFGFSMNEFGRVFLENFGGYYFHSYYSRWFSMIGRRPEAGIDTRLLERDLIRESCITKPDCVSGQRLCCLGTICSTSFIYVSAGGTMYILGLVNGFLGNTCNESLEVLFRRRFYGVNPIGNGPP